MAASAKTLLVVEDQVLIRHLLALSLTEAGFDVIEAGSGDDAIARLNEEPLHVGTVVTDIDLGSGPNGWQVAERAREIDPAIGIVYVTGAGGAGWSARGVPYSRLIAKPFTTQQVVNVVCATLTEFR